MDTTSFYLTVNPLMSFSQSKTPHSYQDWFMASITW